MQVAATEARRAALAAAASAEKRTRTWKRYQAVWLVAGGETPAAAAKAVRCSVASVYGWVRRWREGGVAALAEGPHPGAARRLGPDGEALLARLLAEDPQARGHQATGWTVPLRRTELATAGYAVSAKPVRRTVRRLG